MPKAVTSAGVEPQDIDKIAAEQAKIVAQETLETARRGGTEADFRREAALILDRAGVAADLEIVPRDEFAVACGRVDSLYNRLILEYKKPGVLAANNSNRTNVAVISQIKDYIRDVAKREKRDAQCLAGVATDGFFYIFVRQVGEGWSVDDPVPVNAASTEMFLRLLFSLCTGAALVPENLVEDFGPRTLRHSAPSVLCTKLWNQAKTRWLANYSNSGSCSTAKQLTMPIGLNASRPRMSSEASFGVWASTPEKQTQQPCSMRCTPITRCSSS